MRPYRIIHATDREVSIVLRESLMDCHLDWPIERQMEHSETGATYPSKFVVCPTCRGRGSIVNPAVDGHGIPSEDFDRDPDFAESYAAGVYDIQCYGCRGDRVVAEPDFPEDIEQAIAGWYENEAYLDRESAGERAMGA